jgi:hypothetical protein
MPPDQRRQAIVDAAVRVAIDKGLASTTVRVAAAFERVAEQDLVASETAMRRAASPTAALRSFFGTYTPADKDWAFQLWLDAWAEAARRPAVRATSRRLNLAWQALLETTIRAGVADGSFRCADPACAAWRILSLLDGLALQVVAHGTTLSRTDVVEWSTAAAETELDLAAGTLTS